MADGNTYVSFEYDITQRDKFYKNCYTILAIGNSSHPSSS